MFCFFTVLSFACRDVIRHNCPFHIISYHIVHFSGASSKTQAPQPLNKTSKFSAVLQMFLETVSGRECRLASCSRCVDRRRHMICHIVQFLSAERRASKYQLIACQNDGCRPGDSTQLFIRWCTSRETQVYAPVLQVWSSQCSDCNTSVMCSVLRVPVTSRAV